MMKISVTAKDIAKGEPNDCELCPIALAVNRQIASTHPAQVTDFSIWLGLNEIPLPASVHRFIDAFDAGLPVEPFEFEVEI